MKCDGMHCCPQLYYQIKPHDSAITKNKDIVPQNKKPQKRGCLTIKVRQSLTWCANYNDSLLIYYDFPKF